MKKVLMIIMMTCSCLLLRASSVNSTFSRPNEGVHPFWSAQNTKTHTFTTSKSYFSRPNEGMRPFWSAQQLQNQCFCYRQMKFQQTKLQTATSLVCQTAQRIPPEDRSPHLFLAKEYGSLSEHLNEVIV